MRALRLALAALLVSASIAAAQVSVPLGPNGGAGGGSPTGAAGGGLTGTYPNPTVATVPGTALPYNGATQANAEPSNPTGTTASTAVMMGLGTTCKITPSFSTRVVVVVAGLAANTTSAHAAGVRLFQGTGTAPANAAAMAGNSLINPMPIVPTSGGVGVPFTLVGLATGLGVGIPIWYDVAVNTDGTGTATITNLTCNAYEF
jgi:hypothetical protein